MVKNRIAIISLVILVVIGCFVVSLTPTKASDPTKLYFKFTIPQGISYSPGWFGEMDKCPQNVTVVYYNDKEGYGVAYTVDKFIPKEVTSVTKVYADNVVSTAENVDGVYSGVKLAERWLPEMMVKDTIIKEEELPLGIEPKTEKAIYCPICGEFVMWYSDKIAENRDVLYCQKGHKFVTKTYDTLKVEKAEAIDE